MRYCVVFIWSILLSGSIISCTNRQQLKELSYKNIGVAVSTAKDTVAPLWVRDSLLEHAPQDRIAITDIHGRVLLMDAVKDEESGEMIATDRLQAVVVEAKFRNVPERNGYVNIAFDVTVPQAMQSADWQIRLAPRLHYLSDTLHLDKIYITGANYRASQLRGYELYNEFLQSIIPDTCDFIDTYTYRHLLEVFIERNYKEIAALKRDTSVIDTVFAANLFGVTQKEAVEHYTKEFLIKRNNRRKENIDEMYAKYVKVPLEQNGIKLDSVISEPNGTLKYYYVQSLPTCKDLKKIDMVMDGGIYKEDKLLFQIQPTEPLTYYVSSMLFFLDTAVIPEADTLYSVGIEALLAKDYETAVTFLRPYKDFNSAVAYVCMDYNNAACALLESLPKSARRDYMLAIVYARLGEGQKAVESFIHSVEQDAFMKHRGNLDPEISSLIAKYNMDTILSEY